MTDIFPISLSVAIILVLISKLRVKLGITNIRKGPQNLHKKTTSRFGGIAIFLSLFLVSLTSDVPEYEFLIIFLLCALPVFLLGIIDDFELHIHPLLRLITAIPSAYLMYHYLGIEAYSVELFFLDNFFDYKIFSIVFICFALAGIVNAFNMIDGINGLVLLFCIATCLSVLIFPNVYSEYSINLFFVALLFSSLGVFVLNFPFGRIFIGDGGAYFLGMAISVGLIKIYQENSLSPWFVFLMLLYPITEAISSAVRRILSKISALNADNRHLHHLIYRRVSKMSISSENVKHSLVTFLMFILYFPFLLAANYFAKDTVILQILSLIFIFFYLFLYIILNPKDFSREKKL